MTLAVPACPIRRETRSFRAILIHMTTLIHGRKAPMTTGTITREEFDERLVRSTERMRQERLTLEAQAAELEDLIGRYSSVLERLEASPYDHID